LSRSRINWRIHLGIPKFEIPEPPLLIDHLRNCGGSLNTQADIDRYCEAEGYDEAELHQPVHSYSWEDWLEHTGSPEAQAYTFLKSSKIFPRLAGFQREGKIIFERCPNPMSSAHWVEVHDRLSLSLLQARLNELDMGIRVRDLG
jgi:hypothetical protein